MKDSLNDFARGIDNSTRCAQTNQDGGIVFSFGLMDGGGNDFHRHRMHNSSDIDLKNARRERERPQEDGDRERNSQLISI